MIVCIQRGPRIEVRRRARGEEESNKETEKVEKTGEEVLWESSLCRFHAGFLLSLLPFPVPKELLYFFARTSHNSPLCLCLSPNLVCQTHFYFWWVFLSEYMCKKIDDS